MRRMIVFVFAVLVMGCASIIGGTRQLISVNSNVAGAEVYFNGIPVGKTPFSGMVKRTEAGQIEVRAAGYTRSVATLNTTIRPIFWGNILAGGTLGSSTDYGTGAMYQYMPSTYFAELRPAQAAAPTGRPSGETCAVAQWRRQAGIRFFVLTHYQELSDDLAKGGGEHMDSLAALVGRPQPTSVELETFRAMRANSRTPLDFAALVSRQARLRCG